MPIGKLNRDIAFFQDLRDNKSLINAVDYDAQFNQLVDFINNQMIPITNSIVGGAIPGVVDLPNTFLHNIGDGSTDFVSINNAAIPDFVLEFSKLAKSDDSCTILASVSNDIGFTAVATNFSDLALVSTIDNTPVWRKIQTDDIENRTITGSKVSLRTIGALNMVPGTLINNIPNNSMSGNNFVDQAITNPKITENSLEIRNLGVISLNGVNTALFAGRINIEHLVLNTLSGNKFIVAPDNNSINTNNFNKLKCITAGKIAPQHITEAKLEMHTIGLTNIGTGHFPSNALSPNFKLTRQELALNYFLKNWFEPTAEQAFTSHGC